MKTIHVVVNSVTPTQSPCPSCGGTRSCVLVDTTTESVREDWCAACRVLWRFVVTNTSTVIAINAEITGS